MIKEIEVKICGLRDAAMVDVALSAGADFIGFVFVPQSPRFIEIAAARPLIAQVKAAGRQAVGLWPGEGSLSLSHILDSGVDILQAHGADLNAELGEVGVPIWRAVGVQGRGDLPLKPLSAARLLLDAKAPQSAGYAGGHGQAFDWSILKNWQAPQPWMLAGGLTPDNVAKAIQISGVGAVDVSSGVERIKGEKDADLIRAFIKSAKGATA